MTTQLQLINIIIIIIIPKKGTIRCSPSTDNSCKSHAEQETRESLQSLHVALVLRPLFCGFFI